MAAIHDRTLMCDIIDKFIKLLKKNDVEVDRNKNDFKLKYKKTYVLFINEIENDIYHIRFVKGGYDNVLCEDDLHYTYIDDLCKLANDKLKYNETLSAIEEFLNS